MESARLSACVPCFNDAALLTAALASVRRQTVTVDDLVVVDDGSADQSAAIAGAFGARVIRHTENLGRGAARARGTIEARHELVLWLDASCSLPPDFAAHAMAWFAEPNVAAVYARIDDPRPVGLVRRWRARHLYRTGADTGISRKGLLITGGCMLRRSAVIEAGNFNAAFPYREDADLGRRLLERGHDVIFDPALRVESTGDNTLGELLERHWRWNISDEQCISLVEYARMIWYSARVMMPHDMRDKDPAAALVSLASPHYRFWKSFRHVVH